MNRNLRTRRENRALSKGSLVEDDAVLPGGTVKEPALETGVEPQDKFTLQSKPEDLTGGTAGVLKQRSTSDADPKLQVLGLGMSEATPHPWDLVGDFIQEHALGPRLEAVCSGKPGFKATERWRIRELVQGLSAAQCQALRDILLPPAQGQALLSQWKGGPPNRLRLAHLIEGRINHEDVMMLLEGHHRGLTAPEDEAMRSRVTAKLALANIDLQSLPPKTMALLHRSSTAVRMVGTFGRPALEAMERYGHDALETVAVISPDALQWIVRCADPSRMEATARELKAFGAQRIARGLQGLLQRGFDIDEVMNAVGVQKATVIGELVAEKSPGERAFRALAGGRSAFWDLVRSVPLKELPLILEHYDNQVDSYGSGETPLLSGGEWPVMDPARTEVLAAAELRALDRAGLPANALDDLSMLTMHQANALSEAMQKELAHVSPEQHERLEQELLGRRFIRFSYYDELYERGVANPEHRYSKETFRSYEKAEKRMHELAAQTRGRPLKKGELTRVMQELHREAAAGLIEAGQTWQTRWDLGRLRFIPLLDAVGLGRKPLHISKEKLPIIKRNPYLALRLPYLSRWSRKDGSQWRYIEFSGAWRVKLHVAALDRFVRKNEGKMPLEALAAELHYRIVSIHPFKDGNGRTSKLMVDFLLLRNGIQPPVWNEGKVLVNYPRWPQVVADGARNRLEVVQRHWSAALDPASQA